MALRIWKWNKMKPKLTPEELEEKRARDSLAYSIARVRGAWASSRLHTYGDMLLEFGYDKEYLRRYFPSELNAKLTLADLKWFISDKQIETDVYFWLKKNPPDTKLTDEEFRLASGLDLGKGQSHDASFPLQVIPYDNLAQQSGRADRVALEDLPCPEFKSHPKSKAKLLPHQQRAVVKLLHNFNVLKHKADYLVAKPGAGKTFEVGEFLLHILPIAKEVSMSPWPIVYITKASVVTQTQRVLQKYFGLSQSDVYVVNIDQLRSIFGDRFLKQEIVVEDGEEYKKYVWRKHLHPFMMIWDEGHSLKNLHSTQSQIGQAFNDIEAPTYQLFVSATMGTKVNDFKCFGVATRIPYTIGLQKNAPLTNEHWADFARNMATDYGKVADTDANQHDVNGVDRVVSYLDEYIVRNKNIRSQFKAFNHVKFVDFVTEKGREEYNTCVEKFLARKAKLEANEKMTEGQRALCTLTILLYLRMGAETNCDRIKLMADSMYDSVQSGKAAGCGSNFKEFIVKMVKYLIEVKGVKRSDISIIWGGQPKETEKQKQKAKLQKNKELYEMFLEEGFTLDDIGLEDTRQFDDELKNLPKEWNLGSQDAKQRQEEIDRFQRGESRYALYTFRAGGVGLSLHHSDEFCEDYDRTIPGFDEWYKDKILSLPEHKRPPKGKARRKESGFVYEEDVKYILTKPREGFFTPTYSGIETVQASGRLPRITSLSDTNQFFIYLRDTIELKVGARQSKTLRCLAKTVRQREDWYDIVINNKNYDDFGDRVDGKTANLIANGPNDKDNDNDIEIEGTYIDDEEDNQ